MTVRYSTVDTWSGRDGNGDGSNPSVEPPFDIMSAVVCAKSIYAVEKCREAVRDHENEITVEIFKGKKYKIVVLGSTGVGKTSLISRYKFGEIGAYAVNATIGASFVTCDLEINGDPVQMQVWDTAGQERFRSLIPMYMRNACAAIIVYDVCQRATFDDVDKWNLELSRLCGQEEPIIVLVGNKNDLDARREVAYGEGVTKALRLGARFYEVNMYQHKVIEEVLFDLASDIQGGESGEHTEFGTETVILEDDFEKKEVITGKKQLFGCCSIY